MISELYKAAASNKKNKHRIKSSALETSRNSFNMQMLKTHLFILTFRCLFCCFSWWSFKNVSLIDCFLIFTLYFLSLPWQREECYKPFAIPYIVHYVGCRPFVQWLMFTMHTNLNSKHHCIQFK